MAPLVEDQWKVFDCPARGEGCTVEFEDPDYAADGRSALYYARVIQKDRNMAWISPIWVNLKGAGGDP